MRERAEHLSEFSSNQPQVGTHQPRLGDSKMRERERGKRGQEGREGGRREGRKEVPPLVYTFDSHPMTNSTR